MRYYPLKNRIWFMCVNTKKNEQSDFSTLLKSSVRTKPVVSRPFTEINFLLQNGRCVVYSVVYSSVMLNTFNQIVKSKLIQGYMRRRDYN